MKLGEYMTNDTCRELRREALRGLVGRFVADRQRSVDPAAQDIEGAISSPAETSQEKINTQQGGINPIG
jgi:hypothetical protein